MARVSFPAGISTRNRLKTPHVILARKGSDAARQLQLKQRRKDFSRRELRLGQLENFVHLQRRILAQKLKDDSLATLKKSIRQKRCARRRFGFNPPS